MIGLEVEWDSTSKQPGRLRQAHKLGVMSGNSEFPSHFPGWRIVFHWVS